MSECLRSEIGPGRGGRRPGAGRPRGAKTSPKPVVVSASSAAAIQASLSAISHELVIIRELLAPTADPGDAAVVTLDDALGTYLERDRLAALVAEFEAKELAKVKHRPTAGSDDGTLLAHLSSRFPATLQAGAVYERLPGDPELAEVLRSHGIDSSLELGIRLGVLADLHPCAGWRVTRIDRDKHGWIWEITRTP